MAWAVLAVEVVFFIAAFGVRTIVQRRRTGDSGFRGVSGAVGSAEWSGGVLFIVAMALGLVGPVLAIVDVVGPLGGDAVAAWNVGGLVVAVAGVALTVVAQFDMGSSWRIGVDRAEHTALVVTGAFGLARNPIFTAMGLAVFGVTVALPSVVMLAALACFVVAVELQVRIVEEPYLLATHGDDYRRYMSRVGRFLPGLGRRPIEDGGPRPARHG